MKANTIRGSYGTPPIPCEIHTQEKADGSTWYSVDGSQNVNLAPHPLEDGVNVETIQDVDAFHWPAGIHSPEELKTAIDA